MGTNDEIGIDLEVNEDNENNDNTKEESDDKNLSETNERHQCWVCFVSEDDDESEEDWVRPCRCKGTGSCHKCVYVSNIVCPTAKWVHQHCLQRWIDEKQKLNSSAPVMCCQCNTQYILVFPPTGRFEYSLEWCDRLIQTASPFLAVTCVVGSIYWSAVSYGALTVMQVMGQEEGRNAMESADPLMLLVGLPTIPVMLILSKFIRWEDRVLKLWLKNHHKIPLLDYIIGSPPEKGRESVERNLFSSDSLSDPISICRLFCGALLLPTAASIVGRCLYDRISSNFHKTILGGLTFIATKGALKIFLRQKQFIRQTKRKVMNYSEDKPQQTSSETQQT